MLKYRKQTVTMSRGQLYPNRNGFRFRVNNCLYSVADVLSQLTNRQPLRSCSRQRCYQDCRDGFYKPRFLVFTALHGMQRGLNDEISVRLSVCPSVCLSNACIVTKRKKDMF